MTSSELRATGREPEVDVESIGSVVRLLCHVRLAVLALGVLDAVVSGTLTGAALAVSILAVPFSYVPARTWQRRGDQLSRSGILLAADLVITAIVLWVTPAFEPMVMYAAATVALFGAAVGFQLAVVMAAPIALLVLVLLNAAPDEPHWALVTGAPVVVAAMAWAGSRIGAGLRAQASIADELRLVQADRAATLERVRMARALHDTVAGDLAGIVLLTHALTRQLRETAARDDVQDLAAQLESACGAAHAATRFALGELRRASEPPHLMLATLCRRWSERTEIIVEVEIDDDVVHLPAAVADDLRSILLEALENVRRHARAGLVTVRVTWADGDAVRLVVTDDGRGLTADPDTELELLVPQDGQEHFGLRGIRERAALHGGDVRVTGRPGRGTSLDVRLQLEKETVR
ncbi:MAG: sensor histidine kinase [Cellulomonas sp.]